MVEPRGRADLAQEAIGTQRMRQLGAEHLERHFAIVLQVAGEIDGGHPADAELALDRVAARQSRRETGGVGHRCEVRP